MIGRIYVDIYLPESEQVIEVNGEYWHGKHDISPSDMIDIQIEGYRRDMIRKKIFGDSLLFLWESEIENNTYEDKLLEFLSKGDA